jgi:AraC-like DNA-binding protein
MRRLTSLVSNEGVELMTYGRVSEPIVARIECAVRMSIPHHGRKLRKRIAKQVAMSERTLSRRLAEKGMTFAQICDRVRFDLAMELLSQGRPVGLVAMDCGFSDLSGFCHAMVRWTGTSARKAMRRAA